MDLSRVVFLGLTAQTWITVGLSTLGFVISLLTFTRTWRHRPSAEVLFIPFDDWRTAFPELVQMKENERFGYPVIAGYLLNAGDGDAYMVDLDFSGYGAFLYEQTTVDGRRALLGFQTYPKLTREPMKQIIVIWHPGSKEISPDDYVGIHWTEQPTRLHKCRYRRLRLRKISSREIHRTSKSRFYRLMTRMENWYNHRNYHHPQK